MFYGMWIQKAEFTRVIPSDGQWFGEAKVWPADGKGPMLAWFGVTADGCLQLVKLIRKDEDLDLDWYDNDLHKAFEDITDRYFGREAELGPGCEHSEFEREVLDFESVKEDMIHRLNEVRDASEEQRNFTEDYNAVITDGEFKERGGREPTAP